jgi:hypothetical protein
LGAHHACDHTRTDLEDCHWGSCRTGCVKPARINCNSSSVEELRFEQVQRRRPALINVVAREQFAEVLEPTWPRRRRDTRGTFLFGRRSNSEALGGAVSHPFDRDRGGLRRSRPTVLRILIAQRGLATDGVETFGKTRERAVGAAAGEIRAPLTAVLITLGPRASAEHVPDEANSERECEG